VIKKDYFLEVLAFFLLIERQYKYVRNENGLNLAHSLIAFSEVFLVRCISLFIVGNGACIMNTLPSHYHDKRINVSRCSKRTFVPTWLLNKCFTNRMLFECLIMASQQIIMEIFQKQLPMTRVRSYHYLFEYLFIFMHKKRIT
jgi:hypothetical protein